MRLYEVQATHTKAATLEEATARYRNILGESEAEAIVKAQNRHVRDGLQLTGAQFKVTGSKIVLCSSAVEGMA